MSMTEQHAATAPLTLPAQIIIEGAVEYPGHLIVAGIVDGDVVCRALTVEQRGVINGSVRAQSVTVRARGRTCHGSRDRIAASASARRACLDRMPIGSEPA